MINNLLIDIDVIYIAFGATDFRKHANSLCELIETKFNKKIYSKTAYIFCNRRRTSIKVLCYDKNGFVLAQKTLLDSDKMKFKWPRNEEELAVITKEQLNWLLSGLSIYQKSSFDSVDIDKSEKIVVN